MAFFSLVDFSLSVVAWSFLGLDSVFIEQSKYLFPLILCGCISLLNVALPAACSFPLPSALSARKLPSKSVKQLDINSLAKAKASPSASFSARIAQT